MALAPCPTTTIDGIDMYASPSRSGRPRNAWVAFEVRSHDGATYGIEMFGGATRAAVARKCTGGLAGLLIVDAGAHEWRDTRYARTPFAA